MMTVAVMQQSRPLFLTIAGDQVVCGVPVGWSGSAPRAAGTPSGNQPATRVRR